MYAQSADSKGREVLYGSRRSGSTRLHSINEDGSPDYNSIAEVIASFDEAGGK